MAEPYNPGKLQALYDLAFGQGVEPNIPEYAKPLVSPFLSPNVAIMRAVVEAMRRNTDAQIQRLDLVQQERDEFDDLIERRVKRGRRKQANMNTMPTISERLRLPTPDMPFPGGMPQPSPDNEPLEPFYRPGTVDAQRVLMHPDVWRNTPVMEHEWHPYEGQFKPPVSRSKM